MIATQLRRQIGFFALALFFFLSFLSASESRNPSQQMALAEHALASGATEEALHHFEQVVKNHPFSSQAAEAQFQIAELLLRKGNDNAAFKAYTTLLKKYPQTPHFQEAVAGQINIANAYLKGKKVKFLGIPLFTDLERSEEMYESILANAPYSKYGALTQFNLALSLERQGKTAEAIAAYQRLIDKYPTSPICDSALYQIGYVYMSLGTREGSQDLSALKESQHNFEDFLLQYPNSEKSNQASENIQSLVTRESKDLLRIARFYDFSKNYKSSAIYYRQVIEKYPQTSSASIAKTRLSELKSSVGEEALHVGEKTPLSGSQMAMRRNMEVEVETKALSTYSGPPEEEITPHPQETPVPQMRTTFSDLTPASSPKNPPSP